MRQDARSWYGLGWLALACLVGCSPATPLPVLPAPPEDEPHNTAANSAQNPANPPAPPGPAFAEARQPQASLMKSVPLDGERVVKYVQELCDLGPRVSGTPAMAKQQQKLTKHFEQHGAQVRRQEFQARQRSRPNSPVAMCNLIASWHPERTRRVVLCAHYDTRPSAHEEPDRANWNRPFASANDGTAGVALLMELAHHLKDLPVAVGVDFVMFDGEEYIFEMAVPYVKEGDQYFFGSQHYAEQYKKQKAAGGVTVVAAILLDLCQAEGARLAVEGHSWNFAPQLVTEVWQLAQKLEAKSFKWEQGFQRSIFVTDDHLALNEVGIPAIDIIDFDYPHWHKLSDTPDKISPKQSVEVGRVLVAWLQTVR